MKRTGYSAIARLSAALVLWAAAGCHAVVPKTYHDPLVLSARDTSVGPADNFFEYANGAWTKDAKIPAARTRLSGFDVVQKLHARPKSILGSAPVAIFPFRTEYQKRDFLLCVLFRIGLRVYYGRDRAHPAIQFMAG